MTKLRPDYYKEKNGKDLFDDNIAIDWDKVELEEVDYAE